MNRLYKATEALIDYLRFPGVKDPDVVEVFVEKDFIEFHTESNRGAGICKWRVYDRYNKVKVMKYHGL